LGERTAFHRNYLSAFDGCDLVFFDRDNGLEIQSLPRERKNSNKFVFRDEISDHYAAGRSVLIYQHYPRRPRAEFLAEIAVRLSEALPQGSIWFFQTPHVAFVLVAQSEHAKRAAAIVEVRGNGQRSLSGRDFMGRPKENQRVQPNGEQDKLRPA
jgi:hypothetical protein